MGLPLFTAAHAAARVLVSDQAIFDEFIRRRKIAAKTLAAGNVFLHAGAVAHHSTHDLLSRETAGELCSSKLVEEPSTGKNIHPAWWAATPIVLPFAMAGGVFYGPYKLGQWMSQQAFEKRLTDVNECEYTSSFCP
jgi:predicted transcriptional regulator